MSDVNSVYVQKDNQTIECKLVFAKLAGVKTGYYLELESENLRLKVHIFLLEIVQMLFLLPDAYRLQILSSIEDELVLKSINRILNMNIVEEHSSTIIMFTFFRFNQGVIVSTYTHWIFSTNEWYCFSGSFNLSSPAGINHLIIDKWIQLHS